MLHFVLYQAALSLLAGVAVQAEVITLPGQVNIKECPITYYGVKYETIYVNKRSDGGLCFSGPYQYPGTGLDCIMFDIVNSDRVEMTIDKTELAVGSPLHSELSKIKTPGKCHIHFSFYQDSSKDKYVDVELHDFGTQAALRVKTTTNVESTIAAFNIRTIVKEKSSSVIWKQLTQDIGRLDRYFELTGCRHSGKFYYTRSSSTSLQTCFAVSCDVTGVFTTTNKCGSAAWCQGNNQCLSAPTTCTLTGSTIIDFNNKLRSIPDRCGYTLMRPSDKNNVAFQVIGILQERRRKDLNFLDQVVLELKKGGDTHHIYLEQGGRVRVDDKMLTLSATAKKVHDVELSKDQTGVTAKIPFSNHMIPIFFDGYTLQIDMTGYKGSNVEGLCGVPGEPSEIDRVEDMRRSNSPSGCETMYKDTDDSTINRNAMTARCDLLKQEPFTACNKHIDPQPYITVCKNVLYKYPAMDGLQCQLLEAYARTCMSHSKDKLQGWRTKASCSVSPQAFCQDKSCSSHEFCGERKTRKGGTENACLCRALYASKYTSANMFGAEKVCGQNSAALSVARCLLEGKGIDYSTLHLNDENCRGKMDDSTHMVTFSFDNKMKPCGTVVTVNNKTNTLVYKNVIKLQDPTGKVTRHKEVQIGFSCFVNEPDIKSMGLGIKIKDSSVIQKVTAGMWTYSLTMNAYTDSARTKAITSSTEVLLDQTIWVELKTDGLDDKTVAVVTDSCWATNQPPANGSLRYDLIIKGCANPDDETVKVKGNGEGMSNYFSFNMFQFSGEAGEVYLHCQVKLCVKKGKTCVPTCGLDAGRRRRSLMSKYEDEYPALITMAWAK